MEIRFFEAVIEVIYLSESFKNVLSQQGRVFFLTKSPFFMTNTNIFCFVCLDIQTLGKSRLEAKA